MDNSIWISQREWSNISEQDRIRIAGEIRRDWCENTVLDGIEIESLNSLYNRFGKRCLDIVISSVMLVFTLPLNGIIAGVTFIDVGRPVLFHQKRIGKNLKPFYLVKFRNMTNERNDRGILLPPDQRITKWGAFVRKTSLDELLNFWSVLKGDMSIIGPRPLPVKYQDRFSAYHQQRHLVRPGLECPFHDSSLAGQGWQGRLDNDVWYVSHLSLKTDVKMAFLLIRKIFSISERMESASGKMGEFMGYYPDGRIMDESRIPRKYLKVLEVQDTNPIRVPRR